MKNLLLLILAWIIFRRFLRLINSFKKRRNQSIQKDSAYDQLTDQEISDADYEEIEKR
jgi:hypothetical protein